MCLTWGDFDEDLSKACNRFQICSYEPPKAFSYTPFNSILQDGPQCGLVALAMYCKMSSKEELDKIVDTAKSLNFTFNGEMFSAEDMKTLTSKYTNNKVELYSGNLTDKFIVDFLLDKGVILVPYDADANHTPCCKNGHKAHWALVSGIIVTPSDEIFVIARQGKSKHLGLWSLEELASSNSQLNEFAPSRRQSDLEYKLPEGGIAGPKGINNKCVLIYNKG